MKKKVTKYEPESKKKPVKKIQKSKNNVQQLKKRQIQLYEQEQERRRMLEMEMETDFEDSTMVFENSSSSEGFRETLSTDQRMIEISPDIIYERLMAAQQLSIKEELQEVRRVFAFIATIGLTPSQEQHLFSLFSTKQLKRLIDIYEGTFSNTSNENLKIKAEKVSRVLRPAESVVAATKKLVARYNFRAQQERDLPFKKGQIIEVISERSNGWWEGRIGNQVGLFPINYTVPYQEEEEEESKGEERERGKKGGKESENSAKLPNESASQFNNKNESTSSKDYTKMDFSSSKDSPRVVSASNDDSITTSAPLFRDKESLSPEMGAKKVSTPNLDNKSESTNSSAARPTKSRQVPVEKKLYLKKGTKKKGTLRKEKGAGGSVKRGMTSTPNKFEKDHSPQNSQKSSEEASPIVPARPETLPFEQKDFPSMLVSDVADFISNIGLGEFRSVFVKNEISGSVLLSLTHEELVNELGMSKLGNRKLLALKINEHMSKWKSVEEKEREEQEKRLSKISRLEKIKTFGLRRKDALQMIKRQNTQETMKKRQTPVNENMLSHRSKEFFKGPEEGLSFFDSEESPTSPKNSSPKFVNRPNGGKGATGKLFIGEENQSSNGANKEEENYQEKIGKLKEGTLYDYSSIYEGKQVVRDSSLEEKENILAQNYLFNSDHWLTAFHNHWRSNETNEKYQVESNCQSLRRIVLKGTSRCLSEAFYATSTVSFNFDLQAIKKYVSRSVIYTNGFAWNYNSFPASEKIRTQVHFMEKDFLDVAIWIQKHKQTNPLVVVSCDFNSPGGKLEGNGRLEEQIWCRSNISQYFKVEKELKQKKFLGSISFPLIPNVVLYTPDVLVFRENEYCGFNFLPSPEKISLLHLSPLDRPQLVNTSEKRNTLGYNPQDHKTMVDRIALSMHSALENRHETLVFTAVGCGRRQNPATGIAAIIKELLSTRFKNKFKHVIFAILDSKEKDSNCNLFKKVFTSQSSRKKQRKKK